MATNEGIPPPPGEEGPPRRPMSPRATWRAIEVVPVFLLALLATALLLSAVMLVSSSCGVRFTAGTLIQELALAGAVVFWVRQVNHGPLAALGLPKRPLAEVVTGVIAGVVFVLLAGLVAELVKSLATAVIGHAPKEPEQVDPCVRGLAFQLTGPVVILAAPLGEELLFRGFFYQGLRRRFSVGVAATLSGLAFGALHYAGVSFLLIIPALVVVGTGLALVYEYRQSLLASMAAHATFNLIGFVTIALGRK